MLRNYFTIAVRNILKHRFFAAINIVGLVIGMVCCLLLFVYVKDELSYDKFHYDYENLYAIGLHGKIAGQELYTSNSSMPVGYTMVNEIPGVEQALRMTDASREAGITFRVDEKVFSEEKIIYADSNFFQFFSFELLQGDKTTVLKEPNSVVLTPALAEKYFGKEDPVGKTIVVGNDKLPCKVTGLVSDAPSNSHFHYKAIISFNTIEKNFFPGWTGNSINTYVRKTAATKVDEINTKLEEIVAKYVGKELEQGLGISYDEFRKNGGIYSYYIYPVTDIHLYSNLPDTIEPSSDIRYVYIFSGVGIFILLIACINFMNLSTARSAGRAKEVGLRKTLGSQRSPMIKQFLMESFIYSSLAVLAAFLISYMILPQFNLLAGKELTFSAMTSPFGIAAALALVIIVGMVAGSYPAFYLTSFNTVEVLKGKVRAGMKSKGMRSVFVIVQFSVSTFLIVATLVVYKQLNYMQTMNLGIDRQRVVTIAKTGLLDKQREAFKTKILSLAGVQKASFTNNNFPGTNNTSVFRIKGSASDHILGNYNADWDHMDVMKFRLKEGRFFSKEFATDTVACLINEAAVHEFGFANAVNEVFMDYQGEQPRDLKVIGIIEDFNFESLKTSVRPLVIRLTDVSRFLMVRYEGDPQQVLASIENEWKQLVPGEPFEYTFLDQDFDSLFRAEMRLRDIFMVFSGLAIFIACLGLFALAAFTTEQRTKEIGIRKALGASVFGLTLLLSKEFTRLVLIAIVPAVALGWYLTDWWLKDFVYRTSIGPWLFIGSALLAISIAWLTVAYQSVKAAHFNPVKSLRYE
jgi:putative ABC transport system permease protein